MKDSRVFNSKVLLFGEYSVIKKSMALAIPFNLFEGSLLFPRKKASKDLELKSLATFIKKLEREKKLFPFDITSFEFDVSQGLFFDSTIPQGFGVGSSGALCAAIYDRYVLDDCSDIQELKKRFSLIESHFHGSSSGFDPLVSFLNQSVLIRHDQSLNVLECPNLAQKGEGGIFLLNTGRSRKTEPLVNLFLEKCKSPDFNQLCTNELLPITNQCIQSFLEQDNGQLQAAIKELSKFQFEHFLPMIPKLFHDVWKNGLEGDLYSLKLCGAGGGGFLLGITQDLNQTFRELSDYETRVVLRF